MNEAAVCSRKISGAAYFINFFLIFRKLKINLCCSVIRTWPFKGGNRNTFHDGAFLNRFKHYDIGDWLS